MKNLTLVDNADFYMQQITGNTLKSLLVNRGVKTLNKQGKLKVFLNNALINATSDMNFTSEDPNITYSIALRKGKFYTK